MDNNNDNEWFDDYFEGNNNTDNIDKDTRPQKNTTRHIRWGAIAILVLIILLIALLIFLIAVFKDDIKDDMNKNTSDVPAGAQTGITTAPPTTDTTDPARSDTTTTTTEPEPPKPPYPVEADIEVIDGVTYINGILIVNKTYGLPEWFDPGVDPVAQAKLEEMYAAAAQDGLTLWTASGYRTYEEQRTLYEDYAAVDGYDAADTYSARPGHSEHETGLTFDVNDPSSTFDGTPEAQWLEQHCAEYGFIIRYPKGKEDITGFMYESWHVRYVGEEVAKVVMENGICLEEYFGITSVYSESE